MVDDPRIARLDFYRLKPTILLKTKLGPEKLIVEDTGFGN